MPGITQQFKANPNVDSNHVIHLFSIHGTFANGTEFGLSEEGSSRSIHAFAQQLSIDQKAHVILHIFEWSGALNASDRALGGERLAQCMRQLKSENTNAKIWTISHSHGGNIVNNCAQSLLTIGEGPIDHAIMLASPEFDKCPKDKINITHITHLFGAVDVTARAGSLQTNAKRKTKNILKGAYNWSIGLVAKAYSADDRDLIERTASISKPQSHDNNEIVQNIRISLNQCPLNHVNIKNILQFLPQILYIANHDFHKCHHISMDISGISIQPSDDELDALEMPSECQNQDQTAAEPQEKLTSPNPKQKQLIITAQINADKEERTEATTTIEQKIRERAEQKGNSFHLTTEHINALQQRWVTYLALEGKTAAGAHDPYHPENSEHGPSCIKFTD